MKDRLITARNEIIMRLRERTSSGGDNIAAHNAGKRHVGNVARNGGNRTVRTDPGSRPGPFLFKH